LFIIHQLKSFAVFLLWQLEHLTSHFAYSVKTNKEKRDRNRDYVFKYLSTHPCVDCGETDPVVLEFDHRENKEYEVSKLILSGTSLLKLSNEIAKCDVRCSNCHRRKTAKDFNWWIINKQATPPAPIEL
jgi:5-methylcytosine-specific restriction endonuclease McrA